MSPTWLIGHQFDSSKNSKNRELQSTFQNIKLAAKLVDFFLRSNKSNIYETVRAQFGKIEKIVVLSNNLYVWALAGCEWRAAASGLKPYPLPRAQSPGTGVRRDWWSWPMGVQAKGIPKGCQGGSLQGDPRILGIFIISFQYKLYSQRKKVIQDIHGVRFDCVMGPTWLIRCSPLA